MTSIYPSELKQMDRWMVKSDGYIHPSIHPRICASGSRARDHRVHPARSNHAGCQRERGGDGPPVSGDSRAAGELEPLLTNARARIAPLAAALASINAVVGRG